MNSDFSFKKFQWKKIIAFALCVLMLLPQTAVFAAGKTQKMEIVIDAKGSSSGNAHDVVSDDNEFVYTGKTIKPVVYVYEDVRKNHYVTFKVISKKYYTVKYGKFNSQRKFNTSATKAVGVYYVQVTFKGKYKDMSPVYTQFVIRPQTVKIKSVKANSKKKATVTWNKLAKSTVTGYQALSSARATYKNDQHIYEEPNFNDTGVNVAKSTASSYKFNRTGWGNKNYVRVRAYKDVKYYDQWGQYEEASIAGDWSKALTVTFK